MHCTFIISIQYNRAFLGGECLFNPHFTPGASQIGILKVGPYSLILSWRP